VARSQAQRGVPHCSRIANRAGLAGGAPSFGGDVLAAPS